MSTTPVLVLPDFSKPFTIEIDACQKGIEALLMQDRRPLAYPSKAIGVRNMGLSIYEKESLTLVTTISKWRYYLEGRHFIVKMTISPSSIY